MDTLYLPFNGSETGLNDPVPNPVDYSQSKVIISFAAGAEAKAGAVYVGVRFDVPKGSGKVTLLLPTHHENFEPVDFLQDGVTRTIIVPLMSVQGNPIDLSAIRIYHISKRSKGDVFIHPYSS